MLELRPEVAAFAQAMEAQLRANDHKPGWKDDHSRDLIGRMDDEYTELAQAVRFRLGRSPLTSPATILNEAADVANFAMMVADVCGGLKT